MLSRSSNTKYSTIVQSPDSIYPNQDLQKEASPSAAFPSIEDEDKNREDEQHWDDEDHQQSEHQDNIFQQLLPQKSFQEMLNQFFVADHKRLLILQSQLRLNRKVDSRSLFFLRKCGTHSIEEFRICYYKGQMIIYQIPKGQKFDLFF